ncbi:magnesium transporter CorA family protein [Pseudaminobacter sp. 19-2017]|uniref:Magnesium transport protein CorA n=1 Tax=Pseudaminobacter soli (ex Zhang et al. 2022) TaxID=2831468 RepID=A0A942E5E9_9HYPH|nr:magnesium transporter CorA family protein [Pseudaminobacter soli]MBS3650880.1 magnesium transporter CorA family protein [Pseudaminobacter soli]
MIRAFAAQGDRLRQLSDLGNGLAGAVWVDLLSPSKEEEQTAERWLGMGIPTREEMEEIETSSRLYAEGDGFVMTATIPAQSDDVGSRIGPVTFVLTKNRLATIRYHEPRVFETFPARAENADLNCTDGTSVLIALLEMIVDRLADHLEQASRDVVDLSRQIFHPTAKKASKRDQDFQHILRRIGRLEHFISDVQDSLVSLQRLSGFLSNIAMVKQGDKDQRGRVKTLSRDVLSLAAHAESLSQKIIFLLDATLGMINIQQNAIIKIVSVAAVVFLPPTLVASVYGMNFHNMPELDWVFGYPLAIGAMILSAVLPFWWFKSRGWL